MTKGKGFFSPLCILGALYLSVMLCSFNITHVILTICKYIHSQQGQQSTGAVRVVLHKQIVEVEIDFYCFALVIKYILKKSFSDVLTVR